MSIKKKNIKQTKKNVKNFNTEYHVGKKDYNKPINQSINYCDVTHARLSSKLQLPTKWRKSWLIWCNTQSWKLQLPTKMITKWGKLWRWKSLKIYIYYNASNNGVILIWKVLKITHTLTRKWQLPTKMRKTLFKKKCNRDASNSNVILAWKF